MDVATPAKATTIKIAIGAIASDKENIESGAKGNNVIAKQIITRAPLAEGERKSNAKFSADKRHNRQRMGTVTVLWFWHASADLRDQRRVNITAQMTTAAIIHMGMRKPILPPN